MRSGLLAAMPLLIAHAACGSARSDQEADRLRHRLESAQNELATRRGDLDENGLAVAEQYVDLIQSELKGNDAEVIRAYNRLFELSRVEMAKNDNKQPTLWRLFRVDYGDIPVMIAFKCEGARELTIDQRLDILEAQSARSKDSRIGTVLAREMARGRGHERTIQYCRARIAEGRKDFLIPLAETRVAYLRVLVGDRSRDCPGGGPLTSVNGDEQIKLLLSEARAAVLESRDPNLVALYGRVLYEADHYLGVTDAAMAYCDFALEQLAQWPIGTEAVAVDLRTQRAFYLQKTGEAPEARPSTDGTGGGGDHRDAAVVNAASRVPVCDGERFPIEGDNQEPQAQGDPLELPKPTASLEAQHRHSQRGPRTLVGLAIGGICLGAITAWFLFQRRSGRRTNADGNSGQAQV